MKKFNEIENFISSKIREINYQQPTPKQVEKWIEEYSKPFIEKSKKWDDLEEKIWKFYEDRETNIYDDQLSEIGQITAKSFGYI